MRRIRGGTAVALMALAAAAPAALAHGGGGTDYSSEVRTIAPAGAGLSARVLDRDDRIELRNATGQTVIVEGYGGEPYARLSADGTVAVNTRSPALYLNGDRFADVDVPARADEGAPPRWRTVSRSGRFEWHDHRAHWMGAERPAKVSDPERRTRVFDWEVPIRVGARDGRIAGTLDWIGRPDAGLPVAAGIALAAIVLGGLGLVLLVRRRRSSRGEDAKGDSEVEAW
jgi:hypothetical protein